MSIELRMKKCRAAPDDPDNPQAPSTTEPTPCDVWMPGAKALGVRWVSALGPGFDIELEHVAPILDELNRLGRG
jgi:hypothetical protein